MILFTTWLWGDKYPEDHVRRLAAGVRRNITGSRFMVMTDRPRDNLPGDIVQAPIPDMHLTEVKGCFARLRLFDPEWQSAQLYLRPGDKVCNLDLDLIVTGNLEWLEQIEAPFSILADVNSTNPCPYNGSIWMLQAGYRPDVWTDFSLAEYKRLGVPFHAFPDDQGWFYHKVPDAHRLGPHCGVYAFKKRGWNELKGNDVNTLPDNACIVAFPGWRDPSKFSDIPWIRQHWRT